MCKSDLRGAAERALAILKKLDAHESNVSIDEDPDAVMAVRFALLDGAQKELATALNALDPEDEARVFESLEVAG